MTNDQDQLTIARINDLTRIVADTDGLKSKGFSVHSEENTTQHPGTRIVVEFHNTRRIKGNEGTL